MKEIIAELPMCDEKKKIESRWEEIGIQLEIDYEKLKNIRYSNHDAPTYQIHYGAIDHHDRSLRDMIAVWLKQESPSPTWLMFTEALKYVAFPELADQLRSKYCK